MTSAENSIGSNCFIGVIYHCINDNAGPSLENPLCGP